ncbi:Putative corA, cytoplasmic domain-containing protein [Septoria linicola]|uniref:CorA, cytoplasmic domain-containing protein n=1 Tax=Septoria linicola TaxID=215465 RepID=A0A9Q9EDV8_9PEZI|nr:Putative corA, cytoplasmic domain-containing protein [Septoria linicola]
MLDLMLFSFVMAQSKLSSDEIASNAQDYYLSLTDQDLHRAFLYLDEPSNLDSLMQAVRSVDTRNLVVDFSDDTAWATTDLTPQAIATLVETDRPDYLGTRWINLWYPSEQTKVLEYLARHYDFSPRLLGLMCSDARAASSGTPRTSLTKSVHRRRGRKVVSFESSVAGEDDELSIYSSSTGSSTIGNIYQIASDVWHYSSVDMGRNYVCLGYNSLYGTKAAERQSNDTSEKTHLPQCVRAWTWLLLTTDKTVISINEDPFPCTQGVYTSFQQRVLAVTRRNLINVFRSLSNVHDKPLYAHNPFTLLPIRTRLGSTAEETAHRSSDAPGLLFYYLFENWNNSYTLVTRKESRYGTELAELRASMFERPTLEHIDRLDQIGKELGVLRRHYDAYTRIIDRLLEPVGPTLASLQNSQIVGSDDSASLSTIRAGRDGVIVREKESLLGVSISSSARVRFRRLRDLIDLYALREVEEYAKQKDSLVTMASSFILTFAEYEEDNFSLIAMSQSIDVDRLTRITLLLTKFTILFLPVSFMSSYFSMPLDDIQYSVTTFWVAFVIVFALSYLALFLFSAINDNLQVGGLIHGVAEGMWNNIGYSWTRVMSMKSKLKVRKS